MPRNTYVPVRQDTNKMRFIEWLTTPPPMREPATEEEFAAVIDVHPKTLYNWKVDPEFKMVWHGETDKVIGGDDRRQQVMDALYAQASDPYHPRSVQAAKLWGEWIEKMSPPAAESGEVVATKPLHMLSDDEIKDLLARGLQNNQVEFHSADAE